MLALPHLSGTECIAALRRLGFRTERRASGLVTLRRANSAVIVPETATLGPAWVGSIVRAAAVDPLEFLLALDRASSPSAIPCPASSAPALA